MPLLLAILHYSFNYSVSSRIISAMKRKEKFNDRKATEKNSNLKSLIFWKKSEKVKASAIDISYLIVRVCGHLKISLDLCD